MKVPNLLIALLLFSPATLSEESILDKWLTHQATIKSWQADVTQIRTIKNLARPMQSEGQLWFKQPNQFRWQLGEPARTVAIRDSDQLLVVYPRLKQAERFPFDGIKEPAMKQALLLLEVGFPSEPESFHAQYQLLSSTAKSDEHKTRFQVLELQPKAASARKLLQKLSLEVSLKDLSLRATELHFADGSSLKNLFNEQSYNQALPEELLSYDLQGFDISEPLKAK